MWYRVATVPRMRYAVEREMMAPSAWNCRLHATASAQPSCLFRAAERQSALVTVPTTGVVASRTVRHEQHRLRHGQPERPSGYV